MKKYKFNIIKNLSRLISFVKIDYSFILLLFICLIVGELKIYLFYVLFIVLHELSHFLIAKKLGYMPSKMKLTFFGASLEGFDDFLIEDEIKIILAGPLFNLSVIIACYLSFWFYPESYIYLSDILVVNLSIFIFNCIPVFPLDMGRFLLAIFSINNSRKNALKFTKTLSFVAIMSLFCVFIISFFISYNFSFGFVIVNLCVLLFSSSKGTSYKRELVFSKKIKLLESGLEEKVFYVFIGVPYYKLLKKLSNNYFSKFIFVDYDFNFINELTEKELLVELGLL